MNAEKMRIKIAEFCGIADKFVLMKRGLYYRPNANGYTSNPSEAWIMTEAQADNYTYPHDEPVTKHRAPLPNYPSDLNACHEAESNLGALQELFTFNLIKVLGWSARKASFFDLMHATAAQRAEALCMVIDAQESTD
jgi:hypothetical protein